MGNYLVTGAAGFIGARTSEMLIQDGHTVVGVDNLNDAYDPRMKEYRLRRLQALPGFTFHKLDISEKSVLDHFKGEKLDAVINLAARAGVRYSVDNPWVYVDDQCDWHIEYAGVVQAKRDKEIYFRIHLQHLRSQSSLPNPGVRLEQ